MRREHLGASVMMGNVATVVIRLRPTQSSAWDEGSAEDPNYRAPGGGLRGRFGRRELSAVQTQLPLRAAGPGRRASRPYGRPPPGISASPGGPEEKDSGAHQSASPPG